MFGAIKARRQLQDIQLVLKVKKGDEDGEEWIRPIRDRVPEACFLSKPMTALETRSLINCCHCFVSLHRSEGFGRGTGEAMFLGRLAMATAWSGNLDYMTNENSLLVDYDLIPVGVGDYPFGEGQHWANAKVEHAVELLDKAIGDPDRARLTAAVGRRTVRMDHGYRAVGLRIMDRVAAIEDLISHIGYLVEVTSGADGVPPDLGGAVAANDAAPSISDPGEVKPAVPYVLQEATASLDRRTSDPTAPPEMTTGPTVTRRKSGRRTKKRLKRLDAADGSEDIAEHVKDWSDVLG